jgi:hypothetical protein
MPNIQVKLRRGTTAQHAGFTGAEGEVTVDTDLDTLRVHDGSTAGGERLAKYSELASAGTGTVTSVDSGTGLTGGPITTSGTLSIAAGGVDTTQLADNGVTFAKMQDINTAKVIGRTTAGSGDPEEVSILDEDAMTSNSATALATQQSIKAYVDAQVAASTVSKYASSWFNDTTGLSNGGTYTFTHSLGTTDVQVQIYMATSSAGADLKSVEIFRETGNYGGLISNVTSTQVEIQLGATGWAYFNSSGSMSSSNWGNVYTHIKVVVIG